MILKWPRLRQGARRETQPLENLCKIQKTQQRLISQKNRDYPKGKELALKGRSRSREEQLS